MNAAPWDGPSVPGPDRVNWGAIAYSLLVGDTVFVGLGLGLVLTDVLLGFVGFAIGAAVGYVMWLRLTGSSPVG